MSMMKSLIFPLSFEYVWMVCDGFVTVQTSPEVFHSGWHRSDLGPMLLEGDQPDRIRSFS